MAFGVGLTGRAHHISVNAAFNGARASKDRSIQDKGLADSKRGALRHFEAEQVSCLLHTVV